MANIKNQNKRPSALWYTPDNIWGRVKFVLGNNVFDPCPCGQGAWEEDGLTYDWAEKSRERGLSGIYINPPTPAKKWAKKALETIKRHPDASMVYAVFCTDLLNQTPALMDYWGCFVTNRIHWIDGNEFIKGEELKKNPFFMKPNPRPTSYNAFFLLSNDASTQKKFYAGFESLGEIRKSYLWTPK